MRDFRAPARALRTLAFVATMLAAAASLAEVREGELPHAEPLGIVRLADAPHERESMGGRARVAAELFGRDRQIAAHAQVLEEVAGRP